eukprot:sb/3466194/
MDSKTEFIEQEKVAFAEWINNRLRDDRYLNKKIFTKYLPIDPDTDHLFDVLKDGIMFSKLINDSAPGSVDERALNYPRTRPLNYFMMLENQNLVLNSCLAIAKLLALTAEDILIRWVNFQLKRVCDNRRIRGFNKEIQDGTVYTYLLTAVAPQQTDLLPLQIQYRYNMFCGPFLAHLCKALDVPEQEDQYDDFTTDADVIELEVEETREEKSFRHWLNSLNLGPVVSYLFEDLKNGYIILQVFQLLLGEDEIDQDRVNSPPFKTAHLMKSVENCNYCVELGQKLGFKLIGFGGNDICSGNKLVLSLLWQMMRCYTLSLMKSRTGKPLGEEEIVDWCNKLVNISCINWHVLV